MKAPISRRIFLGGGAGVLAQAQRIPPADRIAVGMIATGSRSHQLLEAIKRVDGTEITAVCDAYKGRVDRAVERTESRARAVANYKEILADPSIDAVTIGTPDHWHKQMVVEALEAGKDVYCEKPLTYTIDEGLEIAAVAERTAKIVQVGSQGISADNQKTLRQWIRSGKLGKVTMIRAAYNRNSKGVPGSIRSRRTPHRTRSIGRRFWGQPPSVISTWRGSSAGAATGNTPAVSQPTCSYTPATPYTS